jgi:hypothetical protein
MKVPMDGSDYFHGINPKGRVKVAVVAQAILGINVSGLDLTL